MMKKYQVFDRPTNGTTGQDCGIFALTDLTQRIQDAILAAPDATEWVLPALSDGDEGRELDDLKIVVQIAEGDETMTENKSTPKRTQTLHDITGLGVDGPGGTYKPDAKPVPASERCERCGCPGMWISGAGEVLCVKHQDDY